jgi:hypothetical protein
VRIAVSEAQGQFGNTRGRGTPTVGSRYQRTLVKTTDREDLVHVDFVGP